MNLIVYRNAKHILIKAISKARELKTIKTGYDVYSQQSINLRAPVSSFYSATWGTGAKTKPNVIQGRKEGRKKGRKEG